MSQTEIETLNSYVRVKSHSTGKIYRLNLQHDISGIQLKELLHQTVPEEVEEQYGPRLEISNRDIGDEEVVSPEYNQVVDILLRQYPTYIDYLIKSQSTYRRIVFKFFLAIIGSLLIAACAQLSFYLPFDKEVPVTMQTFGILLMATLLGPWFGFLCTAFYIFEGGVGAPFFANQSGGISVLSGPTAGFLFGFLLTSLVTGRFAQFGWDRKFHKILVALISGNLVLYVLGVPVLAHFIGWKEAFLQGFVPFLVGDALKVFIASLLIPLFWKLTALIFNINQRTIISFRDYCCSEISFN